MKKKGLPITFREALDIIGVSRNTLYAWVEEGKVPSHRVGGRILFYEAELRQWMRQR